MNAKRPNHTTITARDEEIHQEQRDLERIIYPLLIAGVLLSSALLLLGLLLVLFTPAAMPHTAPQFSEIIPLALAFQPAGLFGLGLLVLIATPILRVAFSVVGFLIERDFRFALITLAVLVIILISIFLGEG